MTDRCPYCSFDPTNMNDYCDDHRPGQKKKRSPESRPPTPSEIELYRKRVGYELNPEDVTPYEWKTMHRLVDEHIDLANRILKEREALDRAIAEKNDEQ